MKFPVKIVHISNNILYDAEAEGVFFPSVYGETEVAPLHAPLVSLMPEGVIIVKEVGEEGKTLFFRINQGLMRFDGENLFALVE